MAERKFDFDPKPDSDNADVGSIFTLWTALCCRTEI